MFYKPNFCCGCGEKIERSEWGLLTSRRFCDVCEVENKEHVFIFRVGIAFSLLLALFAGAYFGSFNGAATPLSSSAVPLPPVGIRSADRPSIENSTPLSYKDLLSEPAVDHKSSLLSQSLESREQPESKRVSSEDPVFYCGAMTKKGKPCSRRVKANVRCWQHTGQPRFDEKYKDKDLEIY